MRIERPLNIIHRYQLQLLLVVNTISYNKCFTIYLFPSQKNYFTVRLIRKVFQHNSMHCVTILSTWWWQVQAAIYCYCGDIWNFHIEQMYWSLQNINRVVVVLKTQYFGHLIGLQRQDLCLFQITLERKVVWEHYSAFFSCPHSVKQHWAGWLKTEPRRTARLTPLRFQVQYK